MGSTKDGTGASTSPSIKNVLRSRETVDGEPRRGFWHKDMKGARKQWAKLTFLTFGLISAFMFLLLSVYFGSYYDQVYQAPNLTVEVIDLDSLASPPGSLHPAVLGPALATAIASAGQSDPHLGWFNTSVGSEFRLTQGGQGVVAFDYALERVLNYDVWAAVIVNANATSGVWDAVNGGATWNPMGAMTFIFHESRNFYAAEQYVYRLGLEVMRQASAAASVEFTGQVLVLVNASTVLSAAPQGTVVGAFSYNLHSPRPFDQLAGIPATTVGTIYLVIFTFLISVIWNNFGLPLIQDRLTLLSELGIKLIVPFVAYFWLSLHYSLVSLAFLVRFERLFGRGGFVVYWMANWVTMSALGFVMETVFLWLGPFFPFFLVFWVVMNVSVAFLDIADMARFYKYGFLMPVWNLVDMSKAIIFAAKNHLVQNFAVNLGSVVDSPWLPPSFFPASPTPPCAGTVAPEQMAKSRWMAVWMVLLAITVVVQRRNKESAKMKEKWEEMKRKHADDEVSHGEPKGRPEGAGS